MALRIRFQYLTGSHLGYSIERLSDGSLYDFSTNAFVSNPTTAITSLPEDTGVFAGRYKVVLNPTPVSQFSDGDYVVSVHDQANTNNVVAELGTTMHAGDDATVIPQSVPVAIDPWSVLLPASYLPGTAGAILGLNLDARISTRSTYAGGVVAAVAAPVTVAINNDKAGYNLSASGLDAIQVENGINARQALSPILAATAGIVAGAGTGVIIIKGGNSSTTRITATTDNSGNRSSITLTLPT